MRALFIPLLLFLAAILGACNIEANTNQAGSHPLAKSKGETCSVQFRRDALGAAASLPVPPTSDVHNGAELSISGELLKADHSGIWLATGKSEIWIPMECVLLVRFDSGATAFSALGSGH